MTSTPDPYVPQNDPIHCALCSLERLGVLKYHDRGEDGLYRWTFRGVALAREAGMMLPLLRVYRDAYLGRRGGEWANLLHYVSQVEAAQSVAP